jgi:hypothetical protein
MIWRKFYSLLIISQIIKFKETERSLGVHRFLDALSLGHTLDRNNQTIDVLGLVVVAVLESSSHLAESSAI